MTDPSRDRFLLCAEPFVPFEWGVPLVSLDSDIPVVAILAFAFCFPSKIVSVVVAVSKESKPPAVLDALESFCLPNWESAEDCSDGKKSCTDSGDGMIE